MWSSLPSCQTNDYSTLFLKTEKIGLFRSKSRSNLFFISKSSYTEIYTSSFNLNLIWVHFKPIQLECDLFPSWSPLDYSWANRATGSHLQNKPAEEFFWSVSSMFWAIFEPLRFLGISGTFLAKIFTFWVNCVWNSYFMVDPSTLMVIQNKWSICMLLYQISAVLLINMVVKTGKPILKTSSIFLLTSV